MPEKEHIAELSSRVGSLEGMFRSFIDDQREQRQADRDADKERDERIETIANRSLVSWPLILSAIGVMLVLCGTVGTLAYTFHKMAVGSLESEIATLKEANVARTTETKELKKDSESSKNDIIKLQQQWERFDSALDGVYEAINGFVGHFMTLMDEERNDSQHVPFGDHRPFVAKRK